jgi:hypothetical protein
MAEEQQRTPVGMRLSRTASTVPYPGKRSYSNNVPPPLLTHIVPQARIAAVNTILTALGMWALKLPGAGLLSLFVFFCGFIPIAGVIISTVPIAFVALTEYGFTKVGLGWAGCAVTELGGRTRKERRASLERCSAACVLW